MTALEALELSEPLSLIYYGLEHDLLVAIAEQLGTDYGINSATEWRIRQLAQMGAMTEQNILLVARAAKAVPSELQKALMASVDSTLDWLGGGNEVFQDILKGKIESPAAANFVSAFKTYEKQAVDKFNQVNTVMQYKADSSYVNAVNNVFTNWTNAERIAQKELANKQNYLDTLNKNTAHVVTGNLSKQEAVRRTIEEMCDNGIPAFIDKSGREWSPEAYVNMDVRSTVSNVARQTQFSYMAIEDLDIVEISSHAGARELCRPYQGKLYSISGKSGTVYDVHGNAYHYEPLSSTSYGLPGGLFGINCGHQMYPLRDGLFSKTYSETTDYEADRITYQRRQQERALERSVRQHQTKADCLRAAGDVTGAKHYDEKAQQAAMRLSNFHHQN